MLAIQNSLLVVVDIQGGLLKVINEKDALLQNLQKLITGARILGVPMLVSEQVPGKLGPTVPEISSLLEGITPIAKSSFSCCGEDRFMRELDGMRREEILVAGIESHVCVYQTTSDLIRMGYGVHIIKDCISSRTEENLNIGIERMICEGACITSTEMVLFELMKSADCNKFREISNLVK